MKKNIFLNFLSHKLVFEIQNKSKIYKKIMRIKILLTIFLFFIFFIDCVKSVLEMKNFGIFFFYRLIL